MKFKTVPNHLVIIPDGNRRWARSRGLPDWIGHQKMMERNLEILASLKSNNIRYCTIWCFSTENWKRSRSEVKKLLNLFEEYMPIFESFLVENKISFSHFGRKDRLPNSLLKKIKKIEVATSKNKKFHFALAIDYGGRDELIRALKKTKSNFTESSISSHLDSRNFPDVDFLIRTGGEQRLSGIMPWQSTYSELYFTDKYYPDFSLAQLRKALNEFAKRNRRFGK